MNDTPIGFSSKELEMARFFVEREGHRFLEVIRLINFREEGILDSLDIVSLAVFIERTFGKKLNLADLGVFNAMSKFDLLMKLVD